MGVWAYGRMGVWAYRRVGVRTLRWEIAPDKTPEYVVRSDGPIHYEPGADGLGAFLRRHAHTPIRPYALLAPPSISRLRATRFCRKTRHVHGHLYRHRYSF
jgi:hypothetical protein